MTSVRSLGHDGVTRRGLGQRRRWQLNATARCDRALPHVLVVGAGAGAFAALALADYGFPVTLVDRAPGIMAAASNRNGRRLHLGEHYSADIVPSSDECTLNTGRACFLGAVRLAKRFPFVVDHDARWWQLIPPSSMTSTELYEEHLAGLRTYHRALASVDPSVNELFGPPGDRHRKLVSDVYRDHVSATEVAAGYESREPVFDLGRLRRALRLGLQQARGDVRLRLGVEVDEIKPVGHSYRATLRDLRAGRSSTNLFNYVVNATWHEIPKLAKMVRPSYTGAESVRLKAMIAARMPGRLRRLPSFYFHRGVYGNHTNVAGRMAIVSAEEYSNIDCATLDSVPPTWEMFVRNRTDRLAGDSWREYLGKRVLRAYARFVPAFKDVNAVSVNFSTVLSQGAVDLTDPASPVHLRSFSIDEVAPGFINFHPGKLTMAQLAAERLRELLETQSNSISHNTCAEEFGGVEVEERTLLR
jgi:hypothetical protein